MVGAYQMEQAGLAVRRLQCLAIHQTLIMLNGIKRFEVEASEINLLVCLANLVSCHSYSPVQLPPLYALNIGQQSGENPKFIYTGIISPGIRR
jgi:hypothetical protein